MGRQSPLLKRMQVELFGLLFILVQKEILRLVRFKGGRVEKKKLKTGNGDIWCRKRKPGAAEGNGFSPKASQREVEDGKEH